MHGNLDLTGQGPGAGFHRTTIQEPPLGAAGEEGVGGRPAAATVPTIAPGSPLDFALQATLQKKSIVRRVRPHMPKALKVLEKGRDEYERRKAEKTLGKIIDNEHRLYHLSYGMMVGIYTSIATLGEGAGGAGGAGGGLLPMLPAADADGAGASTSAGDADAGLPAGAREQKRRREEQLQRQQGVRARAASAAAAALGALELDDFMKVRKLVFPVNGSALTNTPPHALPHSFKFKDYAPAVFHQLRERFAIDPQDYLKSLGGAYKFIEFNSNSKSGSFFFYSHDGKFMIKTQSASESKFLRRILAHYYQHVMTHPGTYLTRFFGMHRIKMPHLSKTIHFVVMQSVFYGRNEVHEMYDLKGSSVGRAATEREKARGPAHCVLKDQDLVRAIHLGPGRREAFLRQIALDAGFLERMGIMDYSLLLGIHFRSKRDTAERHALAQGPSTAHADAEGDGGGGSGGGSGSGGGVPSPIKEEEEGEGDEDDEVEGERELERERGRDRERAHERVRERDGEDEQQQDEEFDDDDEGDGSAGGGTAPPSPGPASPSFGGAAGAGTGLGVGAHAHAAGTSAAGSSPDDVDSEASSSDRGRSPSQGAPQAAKARRRSRPGPSLGTRYGGHSLRGRLQRQAEDVMAAAEVGLALSPVGAAGPGAGAGLGLGAGAGLSSSGGAGDEGDGGFGLLSLRSLSPHQLAMAPAFGGGDGGAATPAADASGGIEGRDRAGRLTDEIYYLGIIDVLQQYDLRKLGETVFKSLTRPATAAGISSVRPAVYARRFVDFLDKHTQ